MNESSLASAGPEKEAGTFFNEGQGQCQKAFIFLFGWRL
jgi:hypothetical protein